VVGGDSSGGVRVWESETGREVSHMNHGDWISAAVFSHDGQRVASASADGTARVWEAATGQEIARVSHDTGVTAVSFSADDLWIVSGDEALAQVWEASTGLVAARRVHADSLQQVSFSPDGSQILSASYDGVVQVWLWQTEDLIALACGRLTDGFTPEVWSQYLGTEPYRRTCDLASAGR
jgi:WD40 repeat protein